MALRTHNLGHLPLESLDAALATLNADLAAALPAPVDTANQTSKEYRMSPLNLLALGEYIGIAGSLFGNVVGHRLLTGVLSLPDYEALRPYQIGRFYPIKAKNSTEIVPADVIPHPAPLAAHELRTFDPSRLDVMVRHYRHWLGKFGPEGSIIVRLNRTPAAAVPNLLRGDQSGPTGRWGMDRVVNPENHGEVQWLYGVPGIGPGGGELFDPAVQDEIYRAIRGLGVTSVSYEPLRERDSSLSHGISAFVENKDEHRIALFSRILKVMHGRVAEETGTAPLVPEDTFPRRRPRIGIDVQREIRRPKADGFVPKTLQPSLDLGPSERWEPIEPRMLPRHEQPQFVAWSDLRRMGIVPAASPSSDDRRGHDARADRRRRGDDPSERRGAPRRRR